MIEYPLFVFLFITAVMAGILGAGCFWIMYLSRRRLRRSWEDD